MTTHVEPTHVAPRLGEIVSGWRTSKNVEISGNGRSIVWRRPFDTEHQPQPRSEVWMLHDFADLGLAEAGPEQILAFAAKFGPLQLCNEHGLPRTHIPVAALPYVEDETYNTHHESAFYQRLALREDVAAWKKFAGQANAILTAARCLHGDRPIHPDIAVHLLPLIPEGLWVSLPGEDIEIQRYAVVRAMQTWIDWSDIRVTFDWKRPIDQPRRRGKPAAIPMAQVGASSLFGTLALGLALGVTRAVGFAICSGCGRPFLVKRQRPEDTHAWCGEEECNRIKKANEERLSRARKREQSSA